MILMLVYYTFQEEEEDYIPKAKRPKRLQAQWLLTLKSWIKHIAITVESTIMQWKTRKRYFMRVHMARQYVSHPIYKGYGKSMLAWSAVAMLATQTTQSRHIMFDIDSNPIGIDNRCSACISHCLENFVDPPVPTDCVIKCFGGS